MLWWNVVVDDVMWRVHDDLQQNYRALSVRNLMSRRSSDATVNVETIMA